MIVAGPPRGFRSPGARLQSEAPCVCGLSEHKGQKARGSGGTESGTLLDHVIGRFLEYRLLLSKEALNKNFVSGAHCPLCPSLSAALDCGHQHNHHNLNDHH